MADNLINIYFIFLKYFLLSTNLLGCKFLAGQSIFHINDITLSIISFIIKLNIKILMIMELQINKP